MVKNIQRNSSVVLLLALLFSCVRVANPVPDKNTKGKLEQVLERGVLKVVTDFNSSSYFIYRGQPMGFQYDMLQELADYLGVSLEVVVNNDLEEKFNMLDEGVVDLIAVNLTITKERKARMDFTVPHTETRQVLVQRKPVNWQSLSGQSLEDSLIRKQLDLGEKVVAVQRNSSYAQRLRSLSDEIGDTIYIDEREECEEKLIEMVSLGELDYTVCDENVAQLSESYYDNIDVATPISFYQNLAWALDKESDDLRQAIDSWLLDFTKTKHYAVLYKKYFQSSRSAQRVESDYYANTSGKLSPYDGMIKEFSDEIGWDWRLVASMIFQESRFNPEAKSWAGAFGLMQLMPTTGNRFGVDPDSPPKMQIRAGLMYLAWLDNRLQDISDAEERKKFILASYNIGLGHIMDARAIALKSHYNPNVWDNNVAECLLKKADPKYYTDPVVKYGYCRGNETYRYVSDIMDRYAHYKNLVVE